MTLKTVWLVPVLMLAPITHVFAQRDDADVANQSLRGIKGVRVVVGSVDTFRRPVNATLDTPTAEQVKSEAEFYLKKFGIGVAASDSPDQTVPSLHFSLTAQKDDAGGNYYNLNVWLTQLVSLQRDPSIRVEASTWQHETFGYAIGSKPFANTVCRAVGMFALAYTYVNAREKINPGTAQEFMCVRP
jgi:hypothetical protein